MSVEPSPTPADLEDRLAPELRGGDDPGLWLDAARRAAADVAGLDARLESPPRHVVLTLTRVRRVNRGVHPDATATLSLSWERERGGAWEFAGPTPRIRSGRGRFHATVCLPVGTNGLAWADVLVIWRPGAPWARERDGGPRDHETGRQTYRYRRESDGAWSFVGVNEE